MANDPYNNYSYKGSQGGGSSFFSGMKNFDIPDMFSFLFPLADLIGGRGSSVKIPNLSEYGISPDKIRSFANLKRAIGRLGIQKQGAQATRVAVGALPSSLSQSTIPASIASGVQATIGSQIGSMEAQIMGEEQNSLMQSYQVALQQANLQMQQSQQQRDWKSDIFETLAFLPMLL